MQKQKYGMFIASVILFLLIVASVSFDVYIWNCFWSITDAQAESPEEGIAQIIAFILFGASLTVFFVGVAILIIVLSFAGICTSCSAFKGITRIGFKVSSVIMCALHLLCLICDIGFLILYIH